MSAIPDSAQPSLLWDRIKEPCFTPVKGKAPLLPKWPDNVKTYAQCKELEEATGVGLVHFYAATACIDIDDLEATRKVFADTDVDLDVLLSTGFRIYSPKPNRAKLLYRLSPEDHQAQTLRLLKNSMFELRAGYGCQDIIGGSEYPDGGKYTDDAADKALSEPPAELREGWIRIQARMVKARHQHKPSTPIQANGKHSPIYWYNYEHSIEEVLATNSMVFAPTPKWDRWTFRAGSSEGGIVLYPAEGAGREEQLVAFIHHASMGPLSGRIVDAFGLQAWIENPDKDNYINIAVAKYAKEVRVWSEGAFSEPRGTVDAMNSRTNTVKVANPLLALEQMYGVTEDDVKNIGDEEWVYKNMLIEGHILTIIGEGGAGKTAVFVHLAPQFVESGYKVKYINLDAPYSDYKRYQQMAAESGYILISPDVKGAGLSIDGMLDLIDQQSKLDVPLEKEVFIFDTLKKCVDMMQKGKIKQFYAMLRRLTARGATVVLLGHANKKRDSDGNLIYEGTGDVRNDTDELIVMEYMDTNDGRVVSTYVDTDAGAKVRGTFNGLTFIMKQDRTVQDAIGWVDTKKNRKGADRINDRIDIADFVVNMVRDNLGIQQNEVIANCTANMYPYNRSLEILKTLSDSEGGMQKLVAEKAATHPYALHYRLI